ncbi:MAG: conserved protein of unknown function [Nitrospira sp.]
MIPDRQARESAETTFDRNVVVVAGAGTGKTTLLVNRLIHLLMKEPDPIAVTQIVALTFTNKAATEMKVRLRERLTALARPEIEGHRATDGGAVSIRQLQVRYRLDEREIATRAEAALQDLEKAQIGTLHSFAAHLLRLHPLESGVDPAFQEDDGQRFDEHFTEAWDLWIDQELGRQGTHHEDWRMILSAADLGSLRHLARSLSSELVDVDAVEAQLSASGLNPILIDQLRQLASRALVLLSAHDRPKRRKIEQMLAAAGSFLNRLAEQGVGAVQTLQLEVRDCLGKEVGSAVAGWEKPDFAEAASIIKTSQQFLDVDHQYFITLLQIISPLIRSIRASFSAKGWLSFDGLLARARRLLWNHRAVRERVKRDYRAVLVDEFQDTDPVQYDIILAVSERAGHHATDWRDIALDPGKLFIVGDPKQSIYAFRRADIEAFDRVVQKIVTDGGLLSTLTTNFRSDAAVLSPVNDVFDRLFERRPLIQPANVRLEAHPQRPPALADPGVRFRIVAPQEEDAFDAEEAARAEGEALARWLKDELLIHPHMKAGQVALLFRRLTQADAYLDALRRHGIPYVIEGEKHFYRRQEVIDLVNVLRVLDHPYDRLALAGVLRSPLGGCTDSDLYAMHSAGSLDGVNESALLAWRHPLAAPVRLLYRQLARLRRDAATVSLAEVIQLVFDRLPLLELAAASLHGEQAVANLLKVKHTAASLSDRPHLTFSSFVDLMVARLEDQPDEAESPLAEENADAVQILTIHKAKGLEFPVVLLPGLHQGSGRERSKPMVVYDWSSGSYGLSLGEHCTFGSVLIREKFSAREEAERRRILYVGMTRAKDLLVLSGSVTERSAGENVLDLLQEIGEGELGGGATRHVKIGTSDIPHHVVHAPDRTWPKRPLARRSEPSLVDPQAVAELWNERAARWMSTRGIHWHVTPTESSTHQSVAQGRSVSDGQDRRLARLTGVLAHRILERWDFNEPTDRMLDHIAAVLRTTSGPDEQAWLPELTESLRELFARFGTSQPYERLRSATILGREVPFVMPWEDRQVMEGVIDIIYRLDGRIWLADYKTDRIETEEAVDRARRYTHQASVYRAAAERGLGQPIAGFQFIFLRAGIAVELNG